MAKSSNLAGESSQWPIRSGEGAALGTLGISYHSLGQFQKAIEYSEQDLAIARQVGDITGEARTLGNLMSFVPEQRTNDIPDK
ncbi:tetratricopeptide repeat protein [[Phormidium] sp. ETS-05]|uniref:tetratricopeptide repeat protein n=1 Tax=[Phormidium] sp. ETS-05 TaxID=222819 RepID=UPI0018EEFAF1|nr:tetratricopeptide repeat protein [[Phormidium] sp. ETS-05]